MTRERKVRLAQFTAALGVPILLIASGSGPDQASNGDPLGPGDSCTQNGCHIGTAINGGGGSATLTSSGGKSYALGVPQTLTLTITDSAARVYGFQLSALTQGSNLQAGTFTRGDGQFVVCSNNLARPASGCTSRAPIEYIEHSSPASSGTITITWTPPATNIGPVVIYYAANAANGNGSADRGDHIYNGSLTLLSPDGLPRPLITSAISAGAYGAFTTFTGGSWIEIYGTNLTATSREWSLSDFSGTTAPTTLDGVSVSINGKPAYVWYLVHGATDQLNVQAPTDGAIAGNASIVVTLNGQSSAAFTMVEESKLNPGLLAPLTYRVGGKQYIVGLFNDGMTYACPTGAFAGIACKLPAPGDVLTFYGIGFGPTTNSIPAGIVAPSGSTLSNSLTWQFGGANATVSFAGLAQGFVGLYLFHVVVPTVAPGEYLVTVRVGGIAVPQTMSLRIGP